MNHESNWINAGCDLDIGAEAAAAVAAATPQPVLKRIGAAVKSAWQHFHASSAAGRAVSARALRGHAGGGARRGGGGTTILNQGLGTNLTDSDGELEALQTAQETDPYALGI